MRQARRAEPVGHERRACRRRRARCGRASGTDRSRRRRRTSRRAGRPRSRRRARLRPARARRSRAAPGRVAGSHRTRQARPGVANGQPPEGDASRGANFAWWTSKPRARAFSPTAAISAGTQRAYASDLREFGRWYGEGDIERVDVRVLADWVSELGRGRAGGRLAPATISRKLAAVRALLRFSLGAERCPTRRFARAGRGTCPDAPKEREIGEVLADARRRRPAAGPEPGARRARVLGRAAQRRGGRARPRRRRLRAGARPRPPGEGREGPRDPPRRGGRVPRRAGTSGRVGPSSPAGRTTRCSSRCTAAGWTPRRSAGSSRTRIASGTRSPRICSRAAPTCGRSRSSSATPRSRPPRCTATSTRSACARSMTMPIPDRRPAEQLGDAVEGFLALLTAQRAANTVEAYRRDLSAVGKFLGGPVERGERGRPRALHRPVPRGRARGHDHRQAGGGAAELLPARAAAREARRQPGGRAHAAAPGAHAAAHAVGRRGRAADRRGNGHHAAHAARPGAGRASLRRRAPRLRGGRPRQGGGRPRRPPRARHRQGRQAARRPARTPRRGGAPALSRPRPPVPRHAPPARALPEREGRPAHARGRVPHPAAPRRQGGPRTRARPSPPAAPLVRDASPGRRRRPAQRPGDARPCRPLDDRAVHPHLGPPPPRDVLRRAPARPTTANPATPAANPVPGTGVAESRRRERGARHRGSSDADGRDTSFGRWRRSRAGSHG